MSTNVKVLLVDDNPMVLGMLKQSLSTLGQISTAADAADAAKVARLRNLRLAKEAADKQTAEDEGVATIKTPARKRRRAITP